MESANFLELAIALYKDKVQQEILEKFRAESCRLLQAEAEARRTIARENIMAMARLKIELDKFKLTYLHCSNKCGRIKAIDEYILKIEKNIKWLSYQKNHIRK